MVVSNFSTETCLPSLVKLTTLITTIMVIIIIQGFIQEPPAFIALNDDGGHKNSSKQNFVHRVIKFKGPR